MKKILLLMTIILFFSCNEVKETKNEYKNQIGDTSFDSNLDDPKFQFCDSTNVLHKRAYINYTGGTKALEEELLEQFIYKPEYQPFNGYFIIRFAVNCKDKAGRFRIEVLDSEFNLTTYPKDLKQHIESIFKALKHWNHAIYEREHYDGYKFHNIKIVNGKIQKS